MPHIKRQRRGALSAAVLASAALCVHWGLQGLQTPGLAFSPGSVVVEDVDEGGFHHEKPTWGVTFADYSTRLSSFSAEYAQLLAVVSAIVCLLLALEENPQPPPAQTPVEKRPDFYRVCLMSALLCGVSGMVNAVGIITMGGTVAHQTGDTSHFGRLLGVDGLRFGILLLSFTLGAGVAGFSKADGEALFQRRYSPCLMSAAFGTVAGTLLQWVSGRANWVTLPLWAFAQGIQNGVTSKFSSMPLRTTHHTGTMTDAGSTLGAWLRARLTGDATPNLQKTWLLLICLFSYAGGGVAAKLGTDRWGVLAALPPAGVMAVLALGLLPIASAPKKAV